MTRTAWIAVFLLVSSNAAWVALWLGDDGGAEVLTVEPIERAELEQTIDDLRGEVLRLRADGDDGPGLVGVAPAERGALPGPGESGAEDAGDGPPVATEDAEAAEEARLAAAERKRVLGESLETVKGILKKVMQVQDPALRQEGLAELHAALASTEPTLVEYALSALHSLRTIEFDRTEFRRTVLDLLDSENGGIRRSALYGLHATGKNEADVRFALAGVTDPDPRVRLHVARVLKLYTGGVFTGAAGEAVATLLGDEHDHVRKGTLRGLAGARVTPKIEQALIAVSQRPENRYDAVYHGLSTLAGKSRVVVDALFEHLEAGDHNTRARAHWGLQRGVADQNKPYVARRYAEHLPKFLNPKSQREALQVVARFGDASLVPHLEQYADNELVDPKVREMARKAAEYLRAK